MTALSRQSGTYKVIVERDEDGFFVASVPALPGCHTQAKTYPALLENVREAIQLCLDVAADDPSYQRRVKRRQDPDSTFVSVDMVTI